MRRPRWTPAAVALLVVAAFGLLTACGGDPAAPAADPVGSGTAPGPTTVDRPPVEQIDWADRTYTVRCDGISGAPLTVAVRGGAGTAPGDGVEDGYQVTLGQVAYGDLTGDGRAEAAVPVFCAPRDVSPNFFTVELQVFEAGAVPMQTVPSPPAREPSDFGIEPRFEGKPRIEGNLLVDRVDRWVGADPRANPSVTEPYQLTWNGTAFVEAAG